MDVNANDVQVFLWKILKFSSKILVNSAIKYPFVSFTLLFLFLLYIIFPSMFWFLIYSFPFILSTTVILRIFPSLRNAKEYKRDEKNNDGKAYGTIVGRNGKSLVHVRSVRRRRAKDIRREDDYSQNNVDEKSTIFSTSVNYDLVDKRALAEECPKEIREVEVDSSSNPSQCSYSCMSKSLKPEFCNGSYGRSEKFNSGGSEIGTSEDSEDEEEARETGNKAVEWTLDDQKNLMDLGISEIERNKRLESLIARRKARKLLSLQVRRTLRNMKINEPADQIAHITLPKNNLLPNNIGLFSPGPGSAPSVLIPMRNPFDLPYDPCEEKPDLTGDSFNQEFMAVQNMDVMFCRHESFSLGASLPREFVQDCAATSACHNFGLRQRASKGIACSKPGSKLESKFIGIVEPEQFQEPESKTKVDSADDQIKEVIQVCEQGLEHHNEEDNVEVQTKPIPIEDVNGRPSSSSSSEEDEPFYKIDKNEILKSIASPATRIIAEDRENTGQTGDHSNHDAPHFAKTRSEEHFYYANKTQHYHTRARSIASDLQVEFSEVSSPQMHDENLSSQDEEISMYDVDLDKEIISSSEDLWAASSHLSVIDENESRSREVHEIGDKDIIEFGVSKINNSEDKTLSNTLAEKVTEQNSIGAHSFSPPKTDFPNSCQGHTDFSAKIHGELQSCLVSAQEPSDPCEKLNTELNAIYDVNGSKILQDDKGNQLEKSLTIDSDSAEHIGSQSEKQDKCRHMLESMGSVADNRISSEDSDNRFKKVIEHEELAATSTHFEDQNSLELLQRTEDEQHSSEVGTSGNSLDSDDPQASVLPTNEQIPAAPSPCSSPQSVLQQNFSVDNLSEFQQNIQMEVGQFDIAVENNMPYELRTEVSSEILSQNSMPLEDSNHPHNGADIEQESSHHQEKSTEEVDAHIDIDESTNYEDQMQNSVPCEDTGHESQLNYLMDHEECRKATTSESYEATKLVEENGNSGTHKKSEEDEEAMRHANTHGSTLGNAVKLEISTSNGESHDETILLRVPKEKNDSENSMTCITTEEPTNSSSRSIEESTSVCIVNKPVTNKINECDPERTSAGIEEESER